MRLLLVSTLMAVSLTACGAFSERPEVELSTEMLNRSIEDEGEVFPERVWWASIGSGQLLILLERAEEGSPELSGAAARIARADAEMRRSRAALLPGLSTEVSGTRRSSPWVEKGMDRGGSSYQASFRAAYELDLWGGRGADLRAAEAGVLKSRKDREAVAISLFSE